ncbi:MAG: flippase-like domain-containing protein [Candidatus Diapherotrites archaeon]
MDKYLKTAIVSLIAVFALISLLILYFGGLGNSGLLGQSELITTISSINPVLGTLGALFFVLSITIWIISWAFVLKKRTNLRFSSVLSAGWRAVYGALTPLQVGAEAMRSLHLKESHNTPYSISVSASLLVKGIKFMLIALTSALFLGMFLLTAKYNLLMLFAMLSGFAVVLFAALLFLLPINKKIGSKMIFQLRKISSKIKIFSKLEKFFESYSDYLSSLSLSFFVFITAVVFLSWVFEFLSLLFAFYSANVFIPVESVIVLFVILSILERTPFLPRGIGIVELAGYIYLSMPSLSMIELSFSEIAVVIIVFDVFRLLIPTLLSMGFAFLFKSNQINKSIINN